MEFSEVIEKRHSVRKYTDQPIDREIIDTILSIAATAPSSRNSHSSAFMVVEDKDTLGALSEMRDSGSAFMKNAQAAIVVLGDETKTDIWVENCAISATFVQLAATAMDLGSCWVQIRGRFDKENNDAADLVRTLLDIPGEQQVECIITLGHKDEERRPVDPDKLLWEKVHIGKF